MKCSDTLAMANACPPAKLQSTEPISCRAGQPARACSARPTCSSQPRRLRQGWPARGRGGQRGGRRWSSSRWW
eukprot:13329517-Alexandrium_andersonii.AAC.1